MDEAGKEPDNTIAKSALDNERATLRIPENGVGSMNVNSYIASLTDMANSPISTPEQTKSLNNAIGLYSYLRDNQNAETVGDARLQLEQRKIDQKVVKLWVDEGMAVNPGEYNAIAKGYPEYQNDLKRVRDEVVDRIIGKSQQ